MNQSQTYEQYIKEQLTPKQKDKLEYIIYNKYGPTHFDDKGIGEIIADASDIEERVKVEAPFIITQANLSHESKVFDACLGTGSTTIGLKLHGIDNIISNDIDDELILYSQKQAKEKGTSLKVTRYDWRELYKHFIDEFDAVCCLGNSLTYIFQEDTRREVVKNFYNILKPEGKLIIDTRNYTELLRGNFLNSGKGPYKAMSRAVQVNPAFVDCDMTLFRYSHGNIKHDLLLYPLKDGELERLMINAGFKDIQTFGDYEKDFNPKTTEFYTFIGTKK